jgi:MFS family permease
VLARILPVIGALFINFVAVGASVPLLPGHLRHALGVPDVWAGPVLGLLWASALVGRLVSGPFADRRGRRLSLLLGFGVCCLAGCLYLVPHVGAIALARILHGLGEAFMITAAGAWIVDAAGASRRSQALGYLASGIWGGLAVGPSIAGILGAFPAVAPLVVGCSMVSFLIVWRLEEQRLEASSEPPRPVFRRTLVPGMIVGSVNVCYMALSNFLPLYLATRGGAGFRALTGFSAAVLLTRLVLGGLPDRVGPRRTLWFGLGVQLATVVGLIFATGPWWPVVLATICGIGYSFPWPSLASIVMDQVRANERASALSTLAAYYDLFVALSAAAAGLAVARFGDAAPLVIAAAALVGALGLSFRRELRPEKGQLVTSS